MMTYIRSHVGGVSHLLHTLSLDHFTGGVSCCVSAERMRNQETQPSLQTAPGREGAAKERRVKHPCVVAHKERNNPR